MEIRICVQKIHEKHHGTPHVPRGFHIPQKILRFSASAKAAQRTQMGHGAAVGCRLHRNQNLILAKVMAEIRGEQIKKSGW